MEALMLNRTCPENIAILSELFPLNLNNMDNPEDITAVMKQWKVTPYVYVHHSIRRLVDGDYDGAFKILKFAGSFEGVYYRKGTAKNESFSHTVKLMQYMILHLSDEFKVCSPDMRKPARGGSAGNENKTGSTDNAV